MPDTQFMTGAAATLKATALKTALALSKLRLTKGPYIPSVASLIADLEANECDFDGYPAGGYTLTAWLGPVNVAGGGAVITSPIANVVFGPVASPSVPNDVTGWWIEDAAGDVRLAGTFNPARIMAAVGDGFVMVVQDVEGKNPIIA